VRAPTAAVTALATIAILAAGWHEGSRPRTGLPPGVHILGAPPVPTDTSSPASTRSPAAKKSTRATTARRSMLGATVATPYGNVQVKVIMIGSRIADVRAVHLTDENDRSRQISAAAAPVLRRETLARQSAQIDAVSGATYTSAGYQQSLQAALDRAHL
jgi:uncharacterized protein with FMN-binding domain